MDFNPSLCIEMKYKLIYYPSSLKVRGVYTVLSYDDNMILLKCDKDNLCINGDKITISSLGANELHISGKITGILFE